MVWWLGALWQGQCLFLMGDPANRHVEVQALALYRHCWPARSSAPVSRSREMARTMRAIGTAAISSPKGVQRENGAAGQAQY
jgi:hypothetical protein